MSEKSRVLSLSETRFLLNWDLLLLGRPEMNLVFVAEVDERRFGRKGTGEVRPNFVRWYCQLLLGIGYAEKVLSKFHLEQNKVGGSSTIFMVALTFLINRKFPV